MSRRRFVRGAALGLAAGAVSAQAQAEPEPGEKPLVIGTWPFSKPSNDVALKILLNGGPILDAVEQGIWVTEDAAPDGSVGLGGRPNAAGFVQLDSCIMYGPGHKGGSVAAIEGIRHPISAARRVMEKTRHVMLAGEGARVFAIEQGLESVPVDDRELYEKWRQKRVAERAKKPESHDTIALLALAADGTIAGGCSTSGMAGKLPGRVGDSPILGSGLYVDNEVGAAGATGVGENVMRYCATFMIVEFMRQGLSPHEAIVKEIERIVKSEGRDDLHINFIALDKHGRYGAAGTDGGFKFSVATPSKSVVLNNPGL
ncbi:MAG TPA: N(4)-(beta-N-acetylglucosaminyl)-L-asparaginase [Candidatus Acidoferrales bacterium]|nr:N(4)-(beta-N-acetylglucosaminyl)-L-asparaginase [Candidatus Acidoferrales bacterium]